MSLQEHRKELNSLQKELRNAFTIDAGVGEIIAKFLHLHGILHSARVAPEAPWSYEDLLLEELDEDGFRQVPDGQEHSVAWIVWHLSRIEDVTMNLLVAGRDQVFCTGGWRQKTRSPIQHTGNGTGLEVVRALSAAVDVSTLREYRFAVGQATREVVQALTGLDFHRKVESDRLQRILDEGAIDPLGMDAVDYWGSRDMAGLLLMPPTRHTIIHWNEAHRIIQKL